MITTACEWCQAPVTRGGDKPGRFCSLRCKGDWQQTQKPATKDWLEQKYLAEGLGAYEIAKLVRRDPKQVWNWLRGYGIPIRVRAWSVEPRERVIASGRPHRGGPHQDRDWLEHEYTVRQRSAADIANECQCTENNIIVFLHKFGIRCRTMRETRAIKHWGNSGERNGMYGKRGAEVPNWRGGTTPERQAFYSTPEWGAAVAAVRKRDQNHCQRCDANNASRKRFHIHHIVPFRVRELRAEVSNLITLCHPCHRFVHSRANVAGEFIGKEVPNGR